MQRYRYQWIIYIAITWAVIDAGYWSYYMLYLKDVTDDPVFTRFTWGALMLRFAIVFFASLGVGYFLIFVLKERLRRYPLWLNVLLKMAMLLLSFVAINVILHYTYALFILHQDTSYFYNTYFLGPFSMAWLIKHCLGWVATYLLTQLLIEIYEKYSPGVFLDIILGKYINPRDEKRIVMFLDLKDSTAIAEQLGHKEYFKFIRDFIYYVSTAMLEYNAHIYQYVGDEIVVSWSFSRKNTMLCLKAIIAARKVLQYHIEKFRRNYNVTPEFKVGIHVGTVTIGEIGAIKKDLAMSGDTMNTAARIRTACNELNQKFIVSKDFLDLIDLKEWQAESLGTIELRGKKEGIELYALKI
jgi:adenylate cyclase